MKCKKALKKILITSFLLSYAYAKTQAQGIKFEEELTWSEILKQAKQEKKYIFVDCFTTWCGPCKAMNKQVYPDESVGNLFNSKFISVKMQMDKTKNDNEWVKKRYADAELLGKNYRITSYPAFLFFSPEGILVHKDYGLKQPSEFMAIAQKALIPGLVYSDPFTEYNLLIADYMSGKKNYKKMPYMIAQSQKGMSQQITDTLTKDYYQYLKTQPESTLYTKENLEFLSNQVKHSSDYFFYLFFPNGEKANKIIGNKFFAAHVVDPIIMQEESTHLLGQEGSRTGVIPSVVPIATKEPDWNYLFNKVKTKYNQEYAIRNVLNAKIRWYSNYQWWPQWIASFVKKIDTFGPDTTDELEDVYLSDAAWKIFLQSNDPYQIKSAVKWMQGVCTRNKMSGMWRIWDTYANLLYKAGRTHEAIKWEEKALQYAINNKDKEVIKPMTITIQLMRKGKSTWINYDELTSQPVDGL